MVVKSASDDVFTEKYKHWITSKVKQVGFAMRNVVQLVRFGL